MRFPQSQLVWILVGLIFRIGLLLWGIHQDSTSNLPYTDVDYSVFNQGTKLLVSGCQIQSILNHDESNSVSFEEWSDLQDPIGYDCANGFLPSLARFTLLNDPVSKHLKQSQSPDGDGERVINSIFNNKDSLEFKWTLFCYDLIRPVFLRFATLGNPFKRSTFRYTPILALILSPSQWKWFPISEKYYGKFIFITCDLVVGLLMWDLLDGRRDRDSKRGTNDWLVGWIWLLNPIVGQISTRGSSESIIGVLVLGFLALFLRFNPEIPIEFVGLGGGSNSQLSSSFNQQQEQEDIAKAKELSLSTTSSIKINGSTSHSISEASPSSSKNQIQSSISTSTSISTQDQSQDQPLLPFPLSQSSEPILNWSLTNFVSPILFSFSVHFKLYPIIYSISIVSHLYHTSDVDSNGERIKNLGWKKHLGWVRFAIIAGISYLSINLVVFLL